MTVSSDPTLVKFPKITPQSFVNADGTTKKTIATAGADGMKVVAVNASSTDTGTRVVQLWLTRSAVSYLLHSQTVAIGAGNDGTVAAQNIFSNYVGLPVDNDGQKYLFLESGDTLQASVTVAVTAAKEIDVTCISGNFS